MIGSVSSKSNDLSILDGSTTSKGAEKSSAGKSFGQTLKQSFDQQSGKKIQENQSVKASKADAQAQANGAGNTQAAQKPLNQNKAEPEVSKPESSSQTKTEASGVANQSATTPSPETLPPGKSLPVLQTDAQILNQPSSDPFTLSSSSDADDALLSPFSLDVDPEHLTDASDSSKDRADLGMVGASQMPDTLDMAWQNPMLGALQQNPAGQVLPEQAVSNLPPSAVASAGMPLASVAGLERAALQSMSRVPVGPPGQTPVETGQNATTQNAVSPGLNMNLSLNTESSSQPWAQAQATWVQAEQGLRMALDKMPESVSQKVDALNPFAAVLQGASEGSDGEQVVTLRLDRALTHARWGQDLGERVQWMVNRAMNGAEIRLNPPQLGPIEVRIQMQQEQANVAFTAHHAHVRDAIESAIPKLREMLSQQSLNLVNVDISQHSFAEQRQHSDGLGSGGQSNAGPLDTTLEGEVLEDAAETMAMPIHNGLINTYA